MMGVDAQAFQRARAIFEAALDAPPEDRTQLIAQACGDDHALSAAVGAMLRADAEPHPVLDGDPMAPSARWPPGTLVAGHLRIAALVGRGGMGEVYRARDETLGRDVALKVLPPLPPADGNNERLARFEREAQILAALNHPSIAAIYGVADVGGQPALVLEFVDGPTLAERLSTGPLAVDDIVHIARHVAVALEVAHEQGIVHRDLKPSNIALRPDGTVKLLDFGLAKIVQPTSGAKTETTTTPSITSPSMLERGVLVGTAAYMSPEQARGREADRRSDVWAFGAVLYEMLSGERAFTGDDVAETLAAVLRADIDLARLPASTPAALQQLVGRCLERNASRRLRDIGEARIVLEDLDTATAGNVTPPTTTRRTRQWRGPLTAAAALVAVVTTAGVWMWRAPAPAAAPTTKRFAIDLPDDQVFPVRTGRLLSLSADGQTLVYLAAGQERVGRLYRRRLDGLDAVPIADIGAREPNLSPDGKWVAYIADSTTLKKAPTAGGASQTLAQLPTLPRGIAWADDGSLVVGSFSNNFGLLRIPATGGTPQSLTTPGPGPMHWDPQVLPDGRRILYTSSAPNAPSEVMVLDLETSRSRALTAGALVRMLKNGPLVYVRDNALWAVPFDTVRLEATGDPIRLTESVRLEFGGAMQVSVADDGTVAYLAGGAAPSTHLVSLDRAGRAEPIAMPTRDYQDARVSPDGRRMAVSIRDQNTDIWIWSFDRQTLTRLTNDSAVDTSPAWTPDGTRIIFASRRSGGPLNPYWQAADGTGQPERLVENVNTTDQFSMAPDGVRLLMRLTSTVTGDDIAMLNLSEQPRTLRALINTRFNERSPAVSPDGRWLAYDSDESGRREVYVRPFPDVERGRWQVSPNGGYSPRWAAGGRELVFLAEGWDWLTVPVLDGPAFRAGAASRIANPAQAAATESYDLVPDGKKIIAIRREPSEDTKRLTVALNTVTR